MSILSTDQPKNFKLVPIQWNQGGGSGGGDINKIESISQNNKKLPIDKNKNVNIVTPTKINQLQDIDASNIKDGQALVYDKATNKYIGKDSIGENKFTRNETIKSTVGGLVAGKYNPYNKTPIQILEEALYPYLEFKVGNLTSNLSTLQELNTTITSIKLQINVTKTDKPIQSVKFYDNDTLIQDIINQPNGGTYSYTYSCNITNNTTFKAVITDGIKTITKTLDIKFVRNSYYGIISADNEITESLITSLNKKVIGVKEFTYNNIYLTNQRLLYAYPSEFGNLTSIIDENNFEYIDSYTFNTISINGSQYNVYVLETPISITNALQIYK